MDKADHVIQGVPIDGEPRIRMVLKSLGYLVEGAVCRNRGHGGARDHRLSHQGVRKLEHAMNQTAFFGAQVSAVTGDIDQLTQLGFGVNGSMIERRLQSQQTTENSSRFIKDPEGRAEDLCKEFEWPCAKQGHRLGPFQRHHFGHQLTEHYVQKRDNGKGDDDARQYERRRRQIRWT